MFDGIKIEKVLTVRNEKSKLLSGYISPLFYYCVPYVLYNVSVREAL